MRCSFVMGPPNERVALVLLDARCLPQRLRILRLAPRASLTHFSFSYFLTQPDAPDATVLGGEQWRWLQALPALDAEQRVVLTIFVSSIQLVNNYSYDSENWGLYPAERARLLALLRSWPCAVVVISGDRHYSELALECRCGVSFLCWHARTYFTGLFPQRGQCRVGTNNERHRQRAVAASAAVRLQSFQVRLFCLCSKLCSLRAFASIV